MNAHFVGKDPSPQPSPEGDGASLAVLQFVAIARGEWRVQRERSPFRAVSVTAEERYCLGCCGVRWFDVVSGVRGQGIGVEVTICRCCECTVEVEI